MREAPPVVDVNGDSTVAVGMVGMVPHADLIDDGVDFHGVNMPGPVRQCSLDVVAGSRADDQHVLEWRAPPASRFSR